MGELEDLIKQLCADLSPADRILWAGYLIDHRADEISPEDLAELRHRRNRMIVEMTYDGLLGLPLQHDEVVH